MALQPEGLRFSLCAARAAAADRAFGGRLGLGARMLISLMVRAILDNMQWLGTNDFSAYLAVPAAIDFQAEHQLAGRAPGMPRSALPGS